MGQRAVVPQNHRPLTLQSVLYKQNEISEHLLKHQQLSLLPSRDIPIFHGDPLQYKSFIRAFEHAIETKTDSSHDRLHFLEQYTAGQPRELVRSCAHMDPKSGYKEAKRLLQEHF